MTTRGCPALVVHANRKCSAEVGVRARLVATRVTLAQCNLALANNMERHRFYEYEDFRCCLVYKVENVRT